MKKILTLILLFTIALFYSIDTKAFDIPLNYGVSDNDEAFVQTKNLFDSTNLEEGVYDGFTGLKTFRNSSIRSIDKKPILSSTTYRFSMLTAVSNNVIFYYYDSNDVYLGDTSRSLLGAGTGGTFTTPSNAFTYNIAIVNTLFTTNPSFSNNYQLELGSVATSFTPYGFLSLNDIFVDGQFLTNPTFDNGTTDWIGNGGTISVLNSVLTFTSGSLSSFRGIRQDGVETLNDVYYAVARIKPIKNSVITLGRDQLNYNVNPNVYNKISNKYISDNVNFVFFQSLAASETFQLDYVYAYHLSDLGIDHLTLIELDLLYDDWFYNSIYDQGFNDGLTSSTAFANGFTAGYELGYGDGYQDAVEEDNAYALGFARGLLEGTDMETGSSLLILIVAVIGFVMMIFGFATKRGIFNLLSVAAFVVLGTLLVEFVGFIIIAVGLVFINVYYAFFGDL